jgi:hypothetical protein
VATFALGDHRATHETTSVFLPSASTPSRRFVKVLFAVSTRANATRRVFDQLSQRPRELGLTEAPQLVVLGTTIEVVVDGPMSVDSLEQAPRLIARLPGVTNVST